MLIYKDLSYKMVGAAMEVHNVLGYGLLEKVYQRALAHELMLRGIPFEEYKPLPVQYKGVNVGNFEADFIIDGKIVVEIKAVSQWHKRFEAQALNYLSITNFRLALLLNFGRSSLQHKRIVR